MRLVVFPILSFFIISVPTKAQLSVKLSAQANILPATKVNNSHLDHSNSEGLRLIVSDYEGSSAELEIHVFRGYAPSVTFTYGIAFAYVPFQTSISLLKTGVDISRFVVDNSNFRRIEVGDKIEDDLPTSLRPYIEWEWDLSKLFSLFVQGGYRFMASETATVTEIIYGPSPLTGEEIPVEYQTDDNKNFYGSGFEFGVGVSVRVY